MRNLTSANATPPGAPVIVTGSSTGLGLETALHLAQRGFDVFATVRDMASSGQAVLNAAAAYGVDVQVRQLDLTDPATVTATVEAVAAEAGGIYGLVNNGGVGLRGCLEDTSEEEIRQVFEANVFGTIAVTKAALPYMRRARNGRIVTISSVGGRISSFGVSVYCASKFALEGLGEGLALELKPFGVHSILVEPGIVKTTRWTANRGIAERARHPDSPYRELFEGSEVVTDRAVNRSRTKGLDVAETVYRALTEPNPRLRYVVGRPASAAILLKRYLPERAFERVYFGPLLRGIERQATSGDRPPVTGVQTT